MLGLVLCSFTCDSDGWYCSAKSLRDRRDRVMSVEQQFWREIEAFKGTEIKKKNKTLGDIWHKQNKVANANKLI